MKKQSDKKESAAKKQAARNLKHTIRAGAASKQAIKNALTHSKAKALSLIVNKLSNDRE